MNEKMAREIDKGFTLTKALDKNSLVNELANMWMAKGYLECFGQAQPLIDAVKYETTRYAFSLDSAIVKALAVWDEAQK